MNSRLHPCRTTPHQPSVPDFSNHSAMLPHDFALKSASPRNLCVLSVSAVDFSSAFSSKSLHRSLSLFLATHPKKPPITPLLATLPKLRGFKPCVCHTCDTPRGCCLQTALAQISTGSSSPPFIIPNMFPVMTGVFSPMSNCRPRAGGPPCARRAILCSVNSIAKALRPRS